MTDPCPPIFVAGVDGCRGGWIAVLVDSAGIAPPRARLCRTFAELLDCAEAPAIIAVDMPIGLPDRTGPGGRAPERSVRRLLGPRRSSVFPVPARAAVMCADYGEASRVAVAHSDPPRRISRQCFHIFARMREIDAVMTRKLESRIYETHPELCFWRLNGGRPMSLPKKGRRGLNGSGGEERKAVLMRHGLTADFLEQALPRKVGRDDFLDACACALIAGRIASGEAEPFPPDLPRDARGLRMAIWV